MDLPEIVTTLTTVLSLALALGMGAALLHLLREERRRSAARVAALLEAAEGRASDESIFRLKAEAAGIERGKADATRTQETTADVTARPPSGKLLETKMHTDMREDAPPVDLDLRPPVDVAGVSDMFAEPDRSSPWGRRLAVAACVAALVSAAGYLLLSREATRADALGNGVATTHAAPLELLSLGHTQQPDSLTITGIVQNPRTGAVLSRVIATVILFSADGSFLASGRAPLDFSTIGPGDESPFVVKVPVAAPVARYRIGFRGEDGRVIAHVDRRASGTMAGRN